MLPTQPPSTAAPNRDHTIDAPRTTEQAWHRSSEADLWLRIQAARALAASERQSRVATEAKLAAVEKALEAERQRRVAAEALAEEAATETLLHRSLGRELELELVARLDAEGSQQTLPTHVTGTGAGPAAAGATVGGIYEHGWLEAVRPLWSRHMGVENMGQVLYSLVRFIKPLTVLEVGAGYTSLFILQALRDNEAELAQLRMQHSGKVPGTGGGGREGLNATGQAEPVTEEAEWYVEECLEARQAVLHCVDNEEHDVFTVEHGGLGAVQRIAERLGLSSWLQVHSADAFDLQLGGSGSHSAHPPAINLPTQWDLVWLDGITTHERFPEYFRSIWQQVSDSGGLALVHSTLTNAVNRQWLCQLATPDRADDHGSVDQSSVIRAAFSFRLAPETADDVSGDEGDDNEEFLDAVAPSSSVQRGGCYDDDQARRAFETLDEDEAGWISDAMVEHGWTHAGIPAAASGLLGELLQRLESERVETGYVNVDEFRQLCKWAAESVGPVDATKSAEQPAVATGGASTKAAPVLPEELAAEVAAQIRALTDVSALCSDEAATAGNVADLTLEWDEPYSVTPLAFGLCALEMTCLLRTAADAKAGSTEADPQALAEEVSGLVAGAVERVHGAEVTGTPQRLEGAGDMAFHDLTHIGLLEPHKRFQNSFSLFQRRRRGYAAPIFSWTP